jgi:sortase (surface protein transpeptidase)
VKWIPAPILALFQRRARLWVGALLVLLLGLALWLGALAALPPRGAQTRATRPAATATPTVGATAVLARAQIGLPQRLLIPSIGVDAMIESVLVTDMHDLQVPQVQPFDDVGWYARGPRPGERGNAAIDGHLDRSDGSPAVFWNLKQLQPGAQIIVEDAAGQRYTFHVDRVERFSPYDVPPSDIFGPSQDTHLNLITCAGTWIPAQHQTNQRLVVYATLDSSQGR